MAGLATLGVLFIAVVGGCRNGGEQLEPPVDDSAEVGGGVEGGLSAPPGVVVPVAGQGLDVLADAPPSRAIPAELNSPRTAAQAVALMTAAPGPPASDEISAHEVLLDAAMQMARRSGLAIRGMALRPPMLMSGGVSPREYYLRVLAAFIGQSGEIAWVDREAPNPAPLPGTREPVTTVLVNVLAYRQHEGRWTEVAAELIITSPDGRVIGQRASVERLSADQPWSLRLDPLRWTR